MVRPDCCAAPQLEADPRWTPIWGGQPERVMRCTSCGALWRESLTSRMGFDGESDREWEEYSRISEEEAERDFGGSAA